MSYEDPVSQGSMALDEHRNAYYERALRKNVTPESVVLDAGAGIGTLGLMAAKLGAKRVILVEPVTHEATIRKLIDANGLTGKVELIHSTIEAVSLPAPVDLITSVFTGNFLLEEDLLPSLFTARDRWLKEGGVLLPGIGRMYVMPVSMDDYYQKQIFSWRRAPAGVSHDVMHGYAVNSLYYDRFNQITHTPLAEPTELMTLDFYSADRAECDAEIDILITAPGTCHGLLGWFDMSFEGDCGGEWLSTGPQGMATHWSQVYLPLDPVLQLGAGDQLKLRVKRQEFGDWHWQVQHGGNLRRHSTFLSRPVSAGEVAIRSPTYRPRLNREGEVLQSLLALMDGQHTTAELSDTLFQEFPDYFGAIEVATRYVSRKVASLGGQVDAE